MNLPIAILLFLSVCLVSGIPPILQQNPNPQQQKNSPQKHSARFLERQQAKNTEHSAKHWRHPRYDYNGINKSSSSSSSSIDFHYQNSLLNHHGNLPLQIDSGGVPFGFGLSQTWAFQSFFFYLPAYSTSYSLILWDCFCSGDRFQAYLNGSPFSTTNTNCTPISDYTPGLCDPYQSDPATCYLTDGFCTNGGQAENVIGGTGFYNLTIRVLESYYGVGIGYVGLYSLDEGDINCDSVMDCSNLL